MDPSPPTALGRRVVAFEGFDVFPAPAGLHEVLLESDEVTALCPVTAQADWYTVRVVYGPAERCLESKTFKLYLHSFRSEGIFVEQLAARIARELAVALAPRWLTVDVVQKVRGGVSITATASAPELEVEEPSYEGH